MADEDTNLVSEIKIEGADESAKAIEDYAKRGSDAFEKVGAAAKKSGDDVAEGVGKGEEAIGEAADKTEAATKKQTTALYGLGEAAGDAGKEAEKSAEKMDKLGYAIGQKLGKSIGNNIKDLAQFTARIAALGSAGIAAGAGILKLAQGIAKAVGGNSTAIKDQTKAQIDANNASLTAEQRADSFESAQRKLFRQFQGGGMEYSKYRDQLYELRQEYNEQVRTAARVAAAQEEVRIANEKLQKQAADREAYQKVADVYGGTLANSLISLGKTVQTLANDFRDTLGPAVSGVIDLINSVLQENASSISKFFQSSAQTISTFISQNGPQIRQAFVSIGQGAASVFGAIIENAPKFLEIFNEQIVPAVKSVYNAIKSVLDQINSLFGTNLTPGMVAIAAIVLRLTGGFKLLFGLVKTGAIAVEGFKLALDVGKTGINFIQFLRLVPTLLGPWGVALTLLVAGLTALYLAVDWKQFGEDINTFVTNFVTWFSELPEKVTTYFTDMWKSIVDTTTGWYNSTIEILKGVVEWFAALPEKIGQIFVDVGTAIVNAFKSAFDAVYQLVAPWVTSVKNALQPIIDIIKMIGDFISSGSGEGTSPPGFARGGLTGHVRGPGTSTSDIIPAWLSNNEFVVRARAVAKYGVGFLNAVNQGRLDIGEPLRFAAGGLVNVGSPTFNYTGDSGDSGSDSPMRPFALHLGGEIFDGLMAPSNIADRLVTYSVQKKTRSAGRKPSWVG